MGYNYKRDSHIAFYSTFDSIKVFPKLFAWVGVCWLLLEWVGMQCAVCGPHSRYIECLWRMVGYSECNIITCWQDISLCANLLCRWDHCLCASLLLRLLQSKYTYLISAFKSPDGYLLFMHSKCSTAHAKSHLKDFQTIYKVGGGGANFENHYLIQN